MNNYLISKRTLRLLHSIGRQGGTVLFVANLDSDSCSLIMSAANICNQEYNSLDRWIPGTLTNKLWVNVGAENKTFFSSNQKQPDLILCFSTSKEVVREVHSLNIPSLYFLSKDTKWSVGLAYFFAYLINDFRYQ